MKVLWVSRHAMTAEQKEDLEKIYGEPVEVLSMDRTVESWKEITEAGKDCEVLAVVLSTVLLADLTNPQNNTKPVLQSVSRRIPTGAMHRNLQTGELESEYAFRHSGWVQIQEVKVKELSSFPLRQENEEGEC